MLLYASASEAFRGEKGQLVYTKTDLRKKKKKRKRNLGVRRKCWTTLKFSDRGTLIHSLFFFVHVLSFVSVTGSFCDLMT